MRIPESGGPTPDGHATAAPWRDPADKHLPKGTVIVSKDRYHYFDSARPRPGSHSFDLALYIYRLFAIHYDNVRIYE